MGFAKRVQAASARTRIVQFPFGVKPTAKFLLCPYTSYSVPREYTRRREFRRMETYVVKVNRKTLEQMPDTDRVLLLSFAHFANELRALERLAVWSLPRQSLSDPENAGRVTLTFMFLKLIAGKLNEAYNLVHDKFYGTGASRELVPLFSEDGKVALEKIKTYFSSGENLVHRIRNLDAFHYGAAEVRVALDGIPDEMEVYLQNGPSVNKLYYFAEVLAVRAILTDWGFPPSEGDEALYSLEREILNVAHWFTILSDQLIATTIKKYIDAIWDGVAIPVDVGPVPGFDEVRIPWFVDGEKLPRDS